MTTTKTMPKLEVLMNGAQLPALPQSAIRLLELSHDPKNGPPEFAAPIEADPGLTGQVLRFVNSSYFGFAQEISSIRLAISLVGVRTIKNFALWSAVFSLMPNPKCGPFELKFLWQDSLRRGIFSRILGKLLKLPDSDDLFAAALLQDMSVPLLAKELPSQYHQLLVDRKENGKRLSELEMETFQWTHAQAGGIMARSWRLPGAFADLVESHTKLDELLQKSDARPGNVIVALSSMLPSTIDDQWSERAAFLAAYERVCGKLSPAARVFRKLDDEFLEFAPVIKLAAPTKPLAEYLNDEPALAK